jgi:large subunit ribosomal protein L22
MKALLKNCHQSPRKVRLVADLVRGKSVVQARAALSFMPQKSSPIIAKLINSAVANAQSVGASAEDLFIKKIAVDKGMVMRRFFPRSRGRATRYAKTLSIIAVELGSKNVLPASTVAKNAKKTVAKTVAKAKTAPKKTSVAKPTKKATAK